MSGGTWGASKMLRYTWMLNMSTVLQPPPESRNLSLVIPYTFFTSSPKRLAIYLQHNNGREKLRKHCPTRQAQHSKIVLEFYIHFSAISITTNWHGHLSRFHLIVFSESHLVIWLYHRLMHGHWPSRYAYPLSDVMQCRIHHVILLRHALVLKCILQEERSCEKIWENAVGLANQENISVSISGCQTNAQEHH